MVTRTLAIFVLILLAGCQLTETEHADIGADPDAITFRPLGEFDVAGAEAYKGSSTEAKAARIELLGRVMDRVKTVRRVVESGQSSETKGRELRHLWLEAQLPETEAWFVDQLAASMVLEDALANETFGPAHDVVIASVERLIERRSPNAALLAETLARAVGSMPRGQLTALAERAAQFGQDWLESTCDECVGKTHTSQEVAASGLRPDVHRIRVGVDALRTLADRAGTTPTRRSAGFR